MKTYKEEIRKVVDDVHCDCCGNSTTKLSTVGPDYATLEACWGYGSIGDFTKYNIQLCETCFLDILTIIRFKRRKVLGPFNYPYETDPLEGERYFTS